MFWDSVIVISSILSANIVSLIYSARSNIQKKYSSYVKSLHYLVHAYHMYCIIMFSKFLILAHIFVELHIPAELLLGINADIFCGTHGYWPGHTSTQ